MAEHTEGDDRRLVEAVAVRYVDVDMALEAADRLEVGGADVDLVDVDGDRPGVTVAAGAPRWLLVDCHIPVDDTTDCPHCRKSYDPTRPACSRCGRPVAHIPDGPMAHTSPRPGRQRNDTAVTIIVGIVASLVLGGGALIVFGGDTPPPPSRPAPAATPAAPAGGAGQGAGPLSTSQACAAFIATIGDLTLDDVGLGRELGELARRTTNRALAAEIQEVALLFATHAADIPSAGVLAHC